MMSAAAVLWLLAKLSLWCSLPFLLHRFVRRRPAALRHLLLTLTLAGALALPVLTAVVPGWQAPSWLRLPDVLRPEIVEPQPKTSELIPRDTASLVSGFETSPRRPQRERGPIDPGDEASRRSLGVHAAAHPEPNRTTAVSSTVPVPVPPFSIPVLLFSLWLLGMAAMAVRTIDAFRRARRVLRDAAVVEDPRALAALSRAGERLGATSLPELLQSRSCAVPFAWGGRRPRILLPASWRQWNDERLTVVLVHELAHLRRYDTAALWIGRAAIALWWFHPLVHRLDTWARRECERAADDAVLHTGFRASTYADHLLAIGRALPRPRPAGVTLMMSNTPDLKQRLLEILRPDRPRQGSSRRAMLLTTAAVAVAVIALAGLRAGPALEAQEGDKELHHHAQDSGKSHWERAYEAHREHRYDDAIADFEAAAESGFQSAVAVYNAACGYALSGRDDEALAALQRALDLGLDRPQLLAEDSDLDSLRTDPRFQALVDDAFRRAGETRDPIDHYRHRTAMEKLELLRETGSQDASLWYQVGTRLLTLRELDLAIEALDQATRLESESPAVAYYNLACAHALDGNAASAFESLEHAIEAGYSDPHHLSEDPDLRSLHDDAEFDRLVALADALDLDRFHSRLWHKHRSSREHHRGGMEKYSAEIWQPAIKHFRDFVDEHPDLGAGWFNLGMAYHYSRRFEEAIEAFEEASDLGFRPATSTYNVACGYSMLDRVDEAFAALEEAIDLGFKGRKLDDDDLDNLRQDPRFRELRLKLQMESERLVSHL